ncbi:hypothetical protein V2611_14160 [Tenacibaculum maritimum]|uniref:hypothetical protein n=1 Tax=Tenacibaculum maritimum TaxID=107401 RepID=UPI0038777A3F
MIKFDRVEKMLNGDDGILMDLRFGDGLSSKKAEKILQELKRIEPIISKSDVIPKPFFYLILDAIMVISSSIEINDNKEDIIDFLDNFTDLLKSYD